MSEVIEILDELIKKAEEFRETLGKARIVMIDEDRLLAEGRSKLDIEIINMAKMMIVENYGAIQGFIQFFKDLKEKLK